MDSQQLFFVRLSGVVGGLAVILGAFGAHGLETRLSPDMLATYDIGVRYHFYHALALLAVAAGGGNLWRNRWTARACWGWVIGIAIFSGTLYLLAVTGVRWLGAITPIGGVAMIAGWFMLIPAAKTQN